MSVFANEVFVEFVVSGRDLDCKAIQAIFENIVPDKLVSRGDRHPAGYPYPEGMWLLSTRHQFNEKEENVNEHIRLLCNILGVYRDKLLGYIKNHRGLSIGFHIIWMSSNLHSGSGPLIEADCIQSIASFGAELVVDSYIKTI
jgi:hypothetical protein